MRQTLLGWEMIKSGEYQCDEYLHLHVIPDENSELLNKVTSPNLPGTTMSEAWKNVLKEPNRYVVVSPFDLLSPLDKSPDTKSFLTYLKTRYWDTIN